MGKENEMIINRKLYRTGDDVRCVLVDGGEESDYIEGKIYVKNSIMKRIYICHNNPNYQGMESPNYLGYKYSWRSDMYRDGEFGIISYDFDDSALSYLNHLKKQIKIFENIVDFAFPVKD